MGLSTKHVSSDHHQHHGNNIIDWDPQTPPLQTSNNCNTLLPSSSVQRQPPQKPEPLKCPRCSSTNTKFCYYNNYNKSQPRHFCKGCKRHWTEGGTLRNVPVGGSRKNKRIIKIPANNAVTVTVTASAATTSVTSVPTATTTTCDRTIGNNGTASFSVGPTSMLLPFSNLSSSLIGYFDPMMISWDGTASFNVNECCSDNNVEESTVTTAVPYTSSEISHQPPPWQDDQTAIMMSNKSALLSTDNNMGNYWSFGDIDSLVSADLNIPWDDLDIKPITK